MMSKRICLGAFIVVILSIFAIGACRSSKTEATSKVSAAPNDKINTASVYSVDDLNGEWNILSISGKEIAPEKEASLRFDAQAKRVSGTAGCNRINSAYETTGSNTSAIAFKQGIATRMACPDMEAEDLLLKALPEIASFSLNGSKSVLSFQDKNGKEILKLKKKE